MSDFCVPIFVRQKGVDKYVCRNLNLKELQCKCKSDLCTFTLYSPSLVESFSGLRGAFGSHINVNSGFRCQSHNEAVGGKKNSQHTKGMAIDLSVVDNKRLDILHSLAEHYFDVVIRYDSFLHCHNK
jgi:uncharacterized protein YcbK (DUF882 family)